MAFQENQPMQRTESSPPVTQRVIYWRFTDWAAI